MQIRCYASLYKSNEQLLTTKAKSCSPKMLLSRGFRSELSIQKKNLIIRNGLDEKKNSYVEALCEAFNVSPDKHFSPYDKPKINKWIQLREKTKPEQYYVHKPCKKCEKIRNSVKNFFRNTFETGNETQKSSTSLSNEANQIRVHIIDGDPNPRAVFESTPSSVKTVKQSSVKTVCFGCEQQEREAPMRGPPIISPVCNEEVCNEQVNASPLGEVFKNFPERFKKVIIRDRPRSLGPRKRVIDRDENRQTSVNEMNKPHSH